MWWVCTDNAVHGTIYVPSIIEKASTMEQKNMKFMSLSLESPDIIANECVFIKLSGSHHLVLIKALCKCYKHRESMRKLKIQDIHTIF